MPINFQAIYERLSELVDKPIIFRANNNYNDGDLIHGVLAEVSLFMPLEDRSDFGKPNIGNQYIALDVIHPINKDSYLSQGFLLNSALILIDPLSDKKSQVILKRRNNIKHGCDYAAIRREDDSETFQKHEKLFETYVIKPKDPNANFNFNHILGLPEPEELNLYKEKS